MIARTHRFHGFNALRHVYARGETVRGPLVAIKYLVNPRRDPRTTYRAAVVVSRKVHKSAVVRNRIRRRIYEVVRRQEPQMAGACDIVITVFGDQLATMDADELEKMLAGQLRRAGIIAAPEKKTHAIVERKKEPTE